ncbi:MAG: hypothetical protein ACR2FY_02860 [Pirellulaceae bacterium]
MMPGTPSKQSSLGSLSELLAIARGIGGALLGAAAGVLVFVVLLNFGVYAIAAIGALTGLGCSLLSQRRSLVLGVVCLMVALLTTFFNEWLNNPFTADPSLSFFLQHIQPKTFFWLSLLLGGGLAFWFGQGNDRTPSRGDS